MTSQRIMGTIKSKGFTLIAIWLLASLSVLGNYALKGDGATPLDHDALLAVSGGAKGNCCKASTTACGCTTGGCTNSSKKCQDANSCPVGGQQANQCIGGVTQYQNATCKSPSGSLGTVNLPQIQCYNTLTCVDTCTPKGTYYYCDQGGNSQPGPMVTPTQPDNTVCPKKKVPLTNLWVVFGPKAGRALDFLRHRRAIE